jgi:hypothetical protein
MTKMNFESWPIVRSRPVGKTYGRSISLFISNGNCFLTTVDVYEDGSIDCWGFVDKALFEVKLKKNWIVCAPKNNQRVSVHNFDGAGIMDDRWFHTQHGIATEVDAVMSSLNPSMENLLDMQGSATELRGRVHIAKMGGSDKKAYRIADATGEEILADNVPVLKVKEKGFELTRLFVFADGLLRIGPAGDLFPVEELASRYAAGGISNLASAGSTIGLPGLGEFRTIEAFGRVSVHDRIGEIHDMIDKMNGQPGTVSICVRRFKDYAQEPTPQAKVALRVAYEAVPEHLRCYCGDMDTRDTRIRAVLYEDQDA